MPQVLSRYPTAPVQYVSGLNQEDQATLERMARELGVWERIVLRGRVDDAELINLYRSADVYVTPTRYEGFGLTLLEAMTAGCPLVTTDIPVVNETVRHSENGWLTRYLQTLTLPPGTALPALATGSSRPASLVGYPEAVAMSNPSSFSLGGSSQYRAQQTNALRAMYGSNADWLDLAGKETVDAIGSLRTDRQHEYGYVCREPCGILQIQALTRSTVRNLRQW